MNCHGGIEMTNDSERKSLVSYLLDRAHQKLTDETAEVLGGVTAGALVYISMYEYLSLRGQLTGTSLTFAALTALGAIPAGERVASEIKRVFVSNN